MDNKQVLRQMIERQAANIYIKTKDMILNSPGVASNALVLKMVSSYINGNEKQWLGWVDDKINMIVDGSFLDSETTLEDAIQNADELVNAAIGQALEKSIGIPRKPSTLF